MEAQSKSVSLLHSKVVEAGPRGNGCKSCGTKIKAPNLLLRTPGEFNRYSGHLAMENYCAACGLKQLDQASERIKELITLLQNQSSENVAPGDLGSKRVRSV